MTRSSALMKIGMQAYRDALEDLHTESEALLVAIANLVAEATKPRVRTQSNKDNWKFTAKGREVYDRLRKEAPEALAYEPAQTRTFTKLGKDLHDACVTEKQLDNLVLWMNSGGLDWCREKPSWGLFVNKAVDWIARAQSRKKTMTEQFNEAMGYTD